jgi:tRNA(Phe) wybutosine-synthesizing methylase Tyw3
MSSIISANTPNYFIALLSGNSMQVNLIDEGRIVIDSDDVRG